MSKEEEQRNVARLRNVWQVMRQPVQMQGNHSVNTSSEPIQSIPVFSNQAQHLGLSEDLTNLDRKEEKALRRLLVKL